jgi:branched-chain amino acid transport system substrate-binding protein
MYKFRSVFTFTLILVSVMALTVPALTASTTPTHAQDETLKIGLLTDLTGALSIYGVEQTNGFMLGLEYATEGTMEVAGWPIEVIVRDNASDLDTANAQVRELIEVDGVEVLQGTVSSTVTGALQVAAKDYEIVLLAGPSASPFITGRDFNEYTFRACRNSFQDALAIANYAVQNLGPNYIQLAPDNAFGLGSVGAFDFGLQQAGATAVSDPVLVAGDTTDFTAALEQVRESGADFVVITWAGATGINLFQQIQDLGLQEDVAIIRAFNSNDIEAPTNKADEGVIGFTIYHYTFPDNEINDWLIERHMEEYDGDVPDLFTECGFASAQALVAALEITEGSTDPADLIPALEGLEWEGPKGTYHMRAEDHQALVPMYIGRIVDVNADDDFRYYELLETVSAEDTAPPCLAPAERSSEEVPCLGEATE